MKKVAILGSTGAVGREMIRYIIQQETTSANKISELTLIIRSPLPEWEQYYDPNNQSIQAEWWKEHVKIILKNNFDDFSDLRTPDSPLRGYDVFVCTLGSRR